MTVLYTLCGWTLRSALLVLAARLGLRLFKVKNPSIRLAAWAVTLAGSLAIPALSPLLPAVTPPASVFNAPRAAVRNLAPRVLLLPAADAPARRATTSVKQASAPVVPNWPAWIIAAYLAGLTIFVSRLVLGAWISRRIVRRGSDTGLQVPEHCPVQESADVAAPVVLGVFRPSILLPPDWREWEAAKLRAVLAHERSHVVRHDPALQLLSAIHRSLLWFSPTSWWMHGEIVRLAEEVSDDAALAATNDRVSYAETLLQFVQRRARVAGS